MISKSKMIFLATKLNSALFVLAVSALFVNFFCASDCFAHTFSYHGVAHQALDGAGSNSAQAAGLVRINSVTNFGAVLNMLGNAIEIFSIAWGGATLVLGCRLIQLNERRGIKRALLGTFVVISGVATAAYFDFLIESMQGCRLF